MDFALLLFVLSVLTGVLWSADRWVWARQRPQGASRPLILEYTAGFFPVIAIVFLIRSFLFEPFNIPSGSMIPTLRIGDLILVKKYSYGVRLPVVDTLVFPTGLPDRGDVAVFRYPKDDSVDYIKRVVGLPGDRIRYIDKRLSVNDQPVTKTPQGSFVDTGAARVASQFGEQLGEHSYSTLNDEDGPGIYLLEAFPFRENCKRLMGGLECLVPEGHYFAVGDNRDNSADSRFWGFVPEANLVGEAVLVWFNFGEVFSGNFSRLGWID
jgi:signal peptidase I